MKKTNTKFDLVIIADTNDADYITSFNTVTKGEINRLKPIIKAVKEFTAANGWEHNWPQRHPREDEDPSQLYPQLTEDDIGLFQEYLPSGEYGIHTITDIFYYPSNGRKNLFNRDKEMRKKK